MLSPLGHYGGPVRTAHAGGMRRAGRPVRESPDRRVARPGSGVRRGGRRVATSRELRHPGALDVDLDGLARALRGRLRGEVGFDPGTRAAYSTDASNFRQVPLGVVTPRDADDVVAVHALARGDGAPVT